MALKTMKGRGSELRFMVMSDLELDNAGFYKRPKDFDSKALSLPEVTTSDAPISTESETEEAPVMYGSPKAGEGARWADSTPGSTSWTMTLSGNVQPIEKDRAAMEALREAQGNGAILWVERKAVNETVSEGGAGFITSGALPIPADEVVTFSFTVQGKGKFWFDTSKATKAPAAASGG